MTDRLEQTARKLISYDLLHHIFMRGHDAKIITDREKIVAVNEAATLLFGYHESDLTGQPIEVLLPDSLQQKHREAHRAGYNHAPRHRSMGLGLDLKGKHKDGHEFPVEIDLNPFMEAEGLRIIVTVRAVASENAKP